MVGKNVVTIEEELSLSRTGCFSLGEDIVEETSLLLQLWTIPLE